MKLSFTTLGCPDWSLEQIAKNARAFGFDGVELRTHADAITSRPMPAWMKSAAPRSSFAAPAFLYSA